MEFIGKGDESRGTWQGLPRLPKSRHLMSFVLLVIGNLLKIGDIKKKEGTKLSN